MAGLIASSVAGLDRAIEAGARLARRAGARLAGRPLTTVIELDWRLGDEVMSLPAFEAYKRAHPGERLIARLRHPELLEGG